MWCEDQNSDSCLKKLVKIVFFIGKSMTEWPSNILLEFFSLNFIIGLLLSILKNRIITNIFNYGHDILLLNKNLTKNKHFKTFFTLGDCISLKKYKYNNYITTTFRSSTSYTYIQIDGEKWPPKMSMFQFSKFVNMLIYMVQKDFIYVIKVKDLEMGRSVWII